MADVNSQSYTYNIDIMIQKNRELLRSFQDLVRVQRQLNQLQNQMNRGQSTASRVGHQSSNGVMNLIRRFGGSVSRSANGASQKQRMQDLSNQSNSIIGRIRSSVSNSPVASSGGAKSIGSTISRITGQLNSKLRPAMNSVFGGHMLKGVAKSATLIGLVATALNHMAKAGGDAYKSQIKMQNSLTQLGSSAKYAYEYASKLNDEMGTPLNKSIESISDMAAQLKGSGWSTGAGELATGAYAMSQKVGLFFQNDPSEVFDKIQQAVLTGQNTLLDYNVQVSDDVLAGWLAAKKGINMYSVELSDGAKQAYRWMMIQEQLADVTSYSGDLTNSTFAKQLQMMNKLEEVGLKLKALFMPLFDWLIDNVNTFVSSMLDGVNQIRSLLGMDKIEWSITNIAQRDSEIVSAIDKQNAAYKKQGEILKKNQNQRLPFDEWISLEAINQLNDSLESTAAGAFDAFGLTGEDNKIVSDTSDGVGININTNDIKEQLSSMTPSEISTKIKVSGKDDLMDIWDNFNFVQKGQYGTEIGIKLIQEGEISKGLEALLYGAVGSFTGINALKELAEGDYVGTIAESAQTALFWFGGWRGKISSIIGEIVSVIAGLAGVDEKTQHILALTGTVLTMLFGWHGALLAIGAALIPVASKLGQNLSQSLSESLGAGGIWGKIQSFDSRKAANKKYGEGTPEAEAYYYELMTAKFGEGADIPKYASGGIALHPQVAEIGHGVEAVIPLESSEGQNFAKNLAQMILDNSGEIRNPSEDARVNNVTVNVPISNYMGDESSLRLLVEKIHNMMLDIERNEGGSFYGSY